MSMWWTVLCVWLALHSVCLCEDLEADPNGYVVYCPCMGRFGNQADQFLGALSFAKHINRTLILPPWMEYPSFSRTAVGIGFDTYYQVAPLEQYHRVILMEDFMAKLAPTVWPPGSRTVFCYTNRGNSETREGCNAKDGSPFGPFWDHSKVDFDASVFHSPLLFDTYNSRTAELWLHKYPVSRYPVLAFVGPPSSFPVVEQTTGLHRYLVWAENIQHQVQTFIADNMRGAPFVGIHLRNGADWNNVCKHLTEDNSPHNVFASAQCLGFRNEYGRLSLEMCQPSDATVLHQVAEAVKSVDAKTVFVATDNNPMKSQIKTHLESQQLSVEVVTLPSKEPHVELAILAQSDHYICNCISTFSAIATRERLTTHNRVTSFWGFSRNTHDEL